MKCAATWSRSEDLRPPPAVCVSFAAEPYADIVAVETNVFGLLLTIALHHYLDR